MYWTTDAGRSGTANIVAGAVARRQIVLNATAPVMVVYDDNDRFNVRGEPTTITVFETELANTLRRRLLQRRGLAPERCGGLL
ncbi:MAG: hypothetical protein OXI84_06965 [bacterium]|nr:hypothetical protein [bacterium]